MAQPLFGQLANVFGRRHITIVILAIFMLGSGICGAANSAVVLIAGRTVQGLGSGAIAMMVDIIISDLVPLRQRGVYIAYVMVANLIGFAIGPWIGGLIVGHISWRWVRGSLVYLVKYLLTSFIVGILHQPPGKSESCDCPYPIDLIFALLIQTRLED